MTGVRLLENSHKPETDSYTGPDSGATIHLVHREEGRAWVDLVLPKVLTGPRLNDTMHKRLGIMAGLLHALIHWHNPGISMRKNELHSRCTLWQKSHHEDWLTCSTSAFVLTAGVLLESPGSALTQGGSSANLAGMIGPTHRYSQTQLLCPEKRHTMQHV